MGSLLVSADRQTHRPHAGPEPFCCCSSFYKPPLSNSHLPVLCPPRPFFLHVSSSSWPSSSTSPHIPTSFLSRLPGCLVSPLYPHHPPSQHSRARISAPLLLSHLTLINGDLQRWQHHYSCSAATPPRTEKNERKRENEGQDRRKMGSDGGGGESLQLEMFATVRPPSRRLNNSRECGVEVFITGMKKQNNCW